MSSSQKREVQNRKQCLADGIFVAAPKRPYCEYVFDVEKIDDGTLAKRKPGRRGPLDDSTAQRIEAVKREGGACWRCKVLKKSCDPGSPCKQCKTKSGKLWKIGCRRGSLHHLLDDVGLDIPGLGSPEWYLPTLKGDFLRIRITHENFEDDLRDLDLSALWSTPESHSTDLHQLRNFLEQFHDIDSYIPYNYSSARYEIIAQCAMIQWDLVSQNSLPPSKWSESTLLIALTLRALAQSLNYGRVVNNLEPQYTCYSYSKPEIINDTDPTIEVLRFLRIPETFSAQLGEDNGSQLLLLIQEIVRITQRVLLKRHPPDWPRLLCVIILLYAVNFDIDHDVSWAKSYDKVENLLWEILIDLTALYAACTKGIHPLAGGDARQAYALIVGDNQLAVTHFNLLNDIYTSVIDPTLDGKDYMFKVFAMMRFN